mmetsp:Transcript_14208/g.39328  ORF Transcript_14208/g.39328 Transcript_14208/m.39328 type:complete len:226 (+) Transcript_14208:153-830(+)
MAPALWIATRSAWSARGMSGGSSRSATRTPSMSSLALLMASFRCALVFASFRRQAAKSAAPTQSWGECAAPATCPDSASKICWDLLGITASRPRSAFSSSSLSSRTTVGSSFSRSGARWASSTLRVLYQPAPPSLRPGANCRSSKHGSRSRSCLQREGARSTPRGHSWTMAMPSKRPRKRVQRSGCCHTPSASAALGVRKPGKGLSWRCPPGEGSRRPSSGSATS